MRTRLGNAFILDDVLIVAANEQIRSIQSLHFLSQPYWGEQINGGIYRPLTIFSFSLEYSIWGGWPAGYHNCDRVRISRFLAADCADDTD